MRPLRWWLRYASWALVYAAAAGFWLVVAYAAHQARVTAHAEHRGRYRTGRQPWRRLAREVGGSPRHDEASACGLPGRA
jgi:hypothetical protein